MDFARLAEQNPWWREPGAVERDFHVRAFASSPVRWEPREAGAFSFDADTIYTLRGPRQVGKTTLLKLLIPGSSARAGARNASATSPAI